MSIPSEAVFIHAISNDIRRKIIRLVAGEPMSFSQLMGRFDLSTGKLTYHLNQLQGFMKKNDGGNYELTPLGRKGLEILDTIQSGLSQELHPLLKEAYLSQKQTTTPLLVQGMNGFIGMVIFMMSVTVFLLILMITLAVTDPGTPVPLIIIPGLMIVGESLALRWLFAVRKRAPAFIKKIEKHVKEENSDLE
nr:winged helix-turn-helix domain-containing protein [Candidatus Sigynarchaeota archaeon]